MHLRLQGITSVKSKQPLIIISHSARALAESACRAGWDVITVDGFADVDTLKASVSSWCIPLSYGAFVKQPLGACLNHLKNRYKQAKVLLGAGAEYLASWVENETDWHLCGNDSETINIICSPEYFFASLEKLDINHPSVFYDRAPKQSKQNCLYKQVNSCGGIGVRRQPPANTTSTTQVGYWQHELAGDPISALFITDGKYLKCLGFNQMHTCAMSQEYPYIYLGATINIDLDEDVKEKTNSYAYKIINHFKLKGVFSLDMILSCGESDDIFVLEVNPRISATYELYEMVNPGLNLVDEHIRVCEGERLSEMALNAVKASYRILYARRDLIVNGAVNWPDWCRDIPEAGRQILQGEPVCSVYANELKGDMTDLLMQREEAILDFIN